AASLTLPPGTCQVFGVGHFHGSGTATGSPVIQIQAGSTEHNTQGPSFPTGAPDPVSVTTCAVLTVTEDTPVALRAQADGPGWSLAALCPDPLSQYRDDATQLTAVQFAGTSPGEA